MSNVRICSVAFTDSDGIQHSVEVSAGSLYEAAALAVAEFRRHRFAEAQPGRATRLTVTVKAPAVIHEISLGKLEAWLASGGKSPNEQVTKRRLRELLEP